MVVEVPRLFDLCMAVIRDELIQGYENNNDIILSGIYGLPSGLFNCLLPHLPPLALQKLHENFPFDIRASEDFELADDDYKKGGGRKRIRCGGILDKTWQALHKTRWQHGNGYHQNQIDVCLTKHDEAKNESMIDWHRSYWESHLQDCVDAVAETALLPSYDGSIGEIQIPVAILEQITGCRSHLIKLPSNCLKFSYHCEQFGTDTRRLRLPGALCIAETCHLLQTIKLVNLELQWIKYCDHQVEGLCKLLNQNAETLKRIEFIHCKLSPIFVNSICDSLFLKGGGTQTHGVEIFSIKRSSFLQQSRLSCGVPDGLKSFLRSGRSLRTLTFSDDHLGRDFARVIFDSISHDDSTSRMSKLDLSENNISGFLLHFRWRPSTPIPIIGSLKSLRVFNLRCCNLVEDDIDCLREALVHMPELEKLDLSDNSIGGGISSLICYFTKISSENRPFLDLKLENCELTCYQVRRLFEVLSTMETPINALSVKGNDRLGNEIGAPLGKLICSGVGAINVEDIGLGSSGFEGALAEISNEELKNLVCINISNNQGGIGAAKFVAKLIVDAHEIVTIDARYNSMSVESLSIIMYALTAASKGKLQHLYLSGNNRVVADDVARGIWSVLETNGKVVFSLQAASNIPYDDEP